MRKNHLLDVAIIGAHKSGSSALFYMLRQHPSIDTHNTDQLPFFLREPDYNAQYPLVVDKYFDKLNQDNVMMMRDGTLFTDPVSLARLKKISPNIKIIVIVREPVSRAYSAFCYARAKGFEDQDNFLKEVKSQVNHPEKLRDPELLNYINMGKYCSSLKKIEHFIPKQNIFILKNTDLKQEPIISCQEIFDFLQIKKYDVTPVVTNVTRMTHSDTLQKVLINDSLIKKLLKTMIPFKFRIQIRKKINDMNMSKKKYNPISKEARMYLEKVYADDLEGLKSEWGVSFDT